MTVVASRNAGVASGDMRDETDKSGSAQLIHTFGWLPHR